MNANCLVAMYHYVRDTAATPFPRLNALAVDDFDRQLDSLARARAIVDYAAFDAAVQGRHAFAAPSALVTFDDGFVDHYEVVWPRLRARGWSGVFFLAGLPCDDPPRVLNVHKTHFLVASLGAEAFAAALQRALDCRPVAAGAAPARPPEVYRYDSAASDAAIKHFLNYELPFDAADAILTDLFTEHLGDEADFARTLYLSRTQIAEMAAAGMTFGFHTEHHRVLSRLPPAGQLDEVASGAGRIRAMTGQQHVPFCYPYGHPHTYTSETPELLAQCGYATAFTTTRRAVDAVIDGRYELPRYDARDLPPFTSAVPDA
jgi:peptidoglycan/xylan/chitin deacetylase (PgdA/CDA1 family)